MPANPWGTNPWGVTQDNWWVPPGTLTGPQNDQETYQRFLLGQGLGNDQTAQERWYQNQYSRLKDTYGATLQGRSDPQNYRFMDFLRDYGGNLASQFAGLSATQRGERPVQEQRLRWLV